MTTVRDVCNALKAIAPLQLAKDWDNVGLLVGDETAEIRRVITCLTLTYEVAAEAVSTGAGLIVTHHPILFKPVKRITANNAEGKTLLLLIRHGIAVYSSHTAWDNSLSGINQQLAQLLELEEIKPLRARAPADQVKIVTFVPQPQLDQVRDAIWNSGAGVIGNYQKCSFNLSGTGTFYGSDASNPVVGQAGRLEQVEEVRLEVVCSSELLERALTALRLTHPYEEPAVDIYPLKSPSDGGGSGRIGTLETPTTLDVLNRRVAKVLRQPYVQFVGDPKLIVARVGIACGAAAEFLRDARRADCQAFLTGEARFHSCLEAREYGIGMILPGHYATERFAMETLAERLNQEFPEIAVTASEHEQDPLCLAPTADPV